MCHDHLKLYYLMVILDIIYYLMYIYIKKIKNGGNENNASFSKQRGKLPYFLKIGVIAR